MTKFVDIENDAEPFVFDEIGEKALINMIKKYKLVYGWVKWSDDDGAYLRLVKSDILRRLSWSVDSEMKTFYKVRVSDGALWIN